MTRLFNPGASLCSPYSRVAPAVFARLLNMTPILAQSRYFFVSGFQGFVPPLESTLPPMVTSSIKMTVSRLVHFLQG